MSWERVLSRARSTIAGIARNVLPPRYSQHRLRRLIAAGAFAEREILAFREDGFGMRIGEILNAMRLADAFAARFVFAWPTTANDGIQSAERVFTAEFLAAHHRPDVDVVEYREVGTWRPADVRHLHRGGGSGVWSISKRSLSHKKKFVLGSEGLALPPMMSMKEAFRRIGFVPELARIRDSVERLPRFDSVIHIRRGDIVAPDSTVALDGTYAHKAIPLALVDVLAERLEAEDRRFAIIGNGVEALDLRNRYPKATFVDQVFDIPPDRPELDDFRDFCLIAHSDVVISAGSAFAMVPTLIGGGLRQRLDDLLPPSDRHSTLLAFLRSEPRPRPDEAVIACAHVLRSSDIHLTELQQAELHEAAVLADPTNPVLVLAQAAHLLDRGRVDAADAALRRSMPGAAAETLLTLARSTDGSTGSRLAGLGGSLLRDHQWSVLEGATAASPWVAFAVGLRTIARGDDRLGAGLLRSAASGLDDATVVRATDEFLLSRE
jgi:hypothetical protein